MQVDLASLLAHMFLHWGLADGSLTWIAEVDLLIWHDSTEHGPSGSVGFITQDELQILKELRAFAVKHPITEHLRAENFVTCRVHRNHEHAGPDVLQECFVYFRFLLAFLVKPVQRCAQSFDDFHRCI